MNQDIFTLEAGDRVFTGVSADEYKKTAKDVAAYNRAYLRKYPNEPAPILLTYRAGTLDVAIRERREFQYSPPPKFDPAVFEGIVDSKFIPTDEAGVNRIRQIAHKLGGLSVRQTEGGCIVAPKQPNDTVNTWVNKALGEYTEPVLCPFADKVCQRTVRPAVSRWNRQNGGTFSVRKIKGKYFVTRKG